MNTQFSVIKNQSVFASILGAVVFLSINLVHFKKQIYRCSRYYYYYYCETAAWENREKPFPIITSDLSLLNSVRRGFNDAKDGELTHTSRML